VNRIIEVETSEKVYSDLVGLCQVISKNYGFAGREFVQWMQETENSAEIINTIQKGYYSALLKSDSTEKQAASASAILAADFIATQQIFKDNNALTAEDLIAIMTKKDDVNVNIRAKEYISELIARNPNKFKTNDWGDYQGEVWGKDETDRTYIIKSVFDREMQNAGFNSTAFLSWAKRNDLTVCDKSKRTKKTRINGAVTNCICLKKSTILE
jgi:hypothetical protein